MTNYEMLLATTGRDTGELEMNNLREKLKETSGRNIGDYIWIEFSKEIPPEDLPIFISNGDNLVAGVYVKDHDPEGWHWGIPAMLTNDDLSDVGNYEYFKNLEFKYWTYQPTPPGKEQLEANEQNKQYRRTSML